MANMNGRFETNPETGEREYVFEELSGQRRTGRVPVRVAAKAISRGSYGDISIEEWAIAKLAADVSTFDGRMKKLTSGSDADRIHAMVDALVRQKLIERGIDPDA